MSKFMVFLKFGVNVDFTLFSLSVKQIRDARVYGAALVTDVPHFTEDFVVVKGN